MKNKITIKNSVKIINNEYVLKKKIIDLINLVTLLHSKTTIYKEIDLDNYKYIYEEINKQIEDVFNYYNAVIDNIESVVYMSPSNYLISRNMAQICIGGTISAAINSSKKEGPSSSLHQSLFLFDSDKKEKILLSLKNNSVQDADSLSRTTGLSAGELAQVLLELELEGFISGDKWGRYSLSGNC